MIVTSTVQDWFIEVATTGIMIDAGRALLLGHATSPKLEASLNIPPTPFVLPIVLWALLLVQNRPNVIVLLFVMYCYVKCIIVFYIFLLSILYIGMRSTTVLLYPR
jgi:hypothetical protein